MNPIKAVKFFSIFAVTLFALTVLGASFYTVPEGHVGIVKRFGKAVEQVDPGFHFKVPMVDNVEEMEVRTRKNVENMPVATFEQMPSQETVLPFSMTYFRPGCASFLWRSTGGPSCLAPKYSSTTSISAGCPAAGF